MCLGIPGRVVMIEEGGRQAVVETQGLKVKVGLTLVDQVSVGDYLLVHAGYAIAVMKPDEALEVLELWKEITDAAVE